MLGGPPFDGGEVSDAYLRAGVEHLQPAPELTYRLYENEPASMPTLTGEQAAAARAAREQATAQSLATGTDEDRTPNPDQGIDR